jgi:hypothetical protein
MGSFLLNVGALQRTERANALDVPTRYTVPVG